MTKTYNEDIYYDMLDDNTDFTINLCEDETDDLCEDEYEDVDDDDDVDMWIEEDDDCSGPNYTYQQTKNILNNLNITHIEKYLRDKKLENINKK